MATQEIIFKDRNWEVKYTSTDGVHWSCSARINSTIGGSFAILPTDMYQGTLEEAKKKYRERLIKYLSVMLDSNAFGVE